MHTCHPAMKTYLEDLEVRCALSIRYQRWSSRYEDKSPFRREIELRGPFTGSPSSFEIPYHDEVLQVEVTNSEPPRGERIELHVNERHFHVASVDGRRITLAFDLERLFEAPQGDLQPGLVLEAVLRVALFKAEQNVKTYAWEDEAARFVTWNVQGIDDQVNGWRQNVRDNEQELERLTTLTSTLVRKNAELREQMKAAVASTKVDREARARAEFRDVIKMVPSPVQSVDLDHGRLVVVLQPITLENDGDEYHMGAYTLQFAADNVRIWSDLGLRYPHPHVSSDGVPCWGNLGPHVAKLMGERNYACLIAVIGEFLHSYNERDAYRRIEHWDPDWSEDD